MRAWPHFQFANLIALPLVFAGLLLSGLFIRYDPLSGFASVLLGLVFHFGVFALWACFVGLRWLRWRAVWDAPFARLGFAAQRCTLRGRQYHRTEGDQRIDVYVIRRKFDLLEVSVRCARPTSRRVRIQTPVATEGLFGLVSRTLARIHVGGPAADRGALIGTGDPLVPTLLASPRFEAAARALFALTPGLPAVVQTSPAGWIFATTGFGTRGEPVLTEADITTWVRWLTEVADAAESASADQAA